MWGQPLLQTKYTLPWLYDGLTLSSITIEGETFALWQNISTPVIQVSHHRILLRLQYSRNVLTETQQDTMKPFGHIDYLHFIQLDSMSERRYNTNEIKLIPFKYKYARIRNKSKLQIKLINKLDIKHLTTHPVLGIETWNYLVMSNLSSAI